jgi:alpha-glucosidase
MDWCGRARGTWLDACAGVRVIVVAAVLAACGTPAGDEPGSECEGAAAPWASVEGGELIARCGGREVHVRPLAGGIVQVRYGAHARRSWAVVGEPAADGGARFGGGAACTAEMLVRVDEECRVHARLADGTTLADDVEPFASGRLVRAANADRVYGLGERTGGLDRRGRAWTFWNTDAYDPAYGGWAPGQDPLYQSIPLELHFARGAAFGVFTDETRRMTIDLSGTQDVIDAPGAAALTQYLIAGPRLPDVIERYTALTGRPARPPAWALGFHQSRWGYANASELDAVVARFEAEQLPLAAIWLDIQHLRGYRSFTVDDAAFPPAMFGDLAARGVKVVAIEDPGIKIDPGAGYAAYDSGLAGGHFIRDASGVVAAAQAWAGASAFPDLSRAATRDWWGEQIARTADRGIAGIWLDVNEPTTFPEGGDGTTLPDDLAVDGDGEPATMAELHNAYALFEAQATYGALAARDPSEPPFVLSRAGYAGIQRYAAVWTGDTPSTWDGLQQTLPMLLGLGLSGVPFVGSDIGGYSGHATPELYARWLALGSISPFARAHVTEGVPGQEPYMFGGEVTAISRFRLGDRYRLLPYLAALADAAHTTGAPPLRPLVWEFPDDAATETLADEAMLGPWLLAAPVLTPNTTSRPVYLPAGDWYEFHSDALYAGPTTITASLSLAALPLYVRAGAILPTAPATVELYPGPSPTHFTFDGTTIDLTPLPDGAEVAISPPRALTLRVHRVDAPPSAIDGATTSTYDAATGIVTAQGDTLIRFHYDPQIADPLPPAVVTFEVHVPGDTPPADTIYVATSATSWQFTPLAYVAPGVARGTLLLPRGQWFEYKYTRGSWDTVEKLADGSESPNRYRFGAPESQVDAVSAWRDAFNFFNFGRTSPRDH